MRPPTRPRPSLRCFLSARPVRRRRSSRRPTAGRDPIAAIRADHWAEAQADAAGYADPVAEKLVLYYRLLAPGAATAGRDRRLHARQPGLAEPGVCWNATASTPSPPTRTRRTCWRNAPPPRSPRSPPCCAAPPPWPSPGQADAAAADARKAWITGLADPAQEAAFLHRWAGILTPDDQWARFQHLALHDPAAAGRQIGRLDAGAAGRGRGAARLPARRSTRRGAAGGRACRTREQTRA